MARDILDAVEHREGVFQRLGHVGLDLLRAGTGVGGHDQQVGQVHRGEQVGLDAGQADKAQHQHQYDRHQYRKWFFYTVFRHSCVPFHSDRPVGQK